jgi:hypothetical protein
MTVHANPIVITTVAAQRGAELRVQADRHRLGTLAQPNVPRRERWLDFLAAAGVVAALAWLFATGNVVGQEPLAQIQPSLVQVADDPHTSAVQKVREAG